METRWCQALIRAILLALGKSVTSSPVTFAFPALRFFRRETCENERDDRVRLVGDFKSRSMISRPAASACAAGTHQQQQHWHCRLDPKSPAFNAATTLVMAAARRPQQQGCRSPSVSTEVYHHWASTTVRMGDPPEALPIPHRLRWACRSAIMTGDNCRWRVPRPTRTEPTFTCCAAAPFPDAPADYRQLDSCTRLHDRGGRMLHTKLRPLQRCDRARRYQKVLKAATSLEPVATIKSFRGKPGRTSNSRPACRQQRLVTSYKALLQVSGAASGLLADLPDQSFA